MFITEALGEPLEMEMETITSNNNSRKPLIWEKGRIGTEITKHTIKLVPPFSFDLFCFVFLLSTIVPD